MRIELHETDERALFELDSVELTLQGGGELAERPEYDAINAIAVVGHTDAIDRHRGVRPGAL